MSLSFRALVEADPDADRLLRQLKNDGAVIPNLFRLELANVIVIAGRRARIATDEIAARLELISSLPIVTDEETDRRAFHEIQALARSEGLTTYNAACLEPAKRRGLPLATRDKALKAAAKRLGVATLP